MPSEQRIETDVLVVGGGMAVMLAAIQSREQGMRVTLVDKGSVSNTGATAYAGGCLNLFPQIILSKQF